MEEPEKKNRIQKKAGIPQDLIAFLTGGAAMFVSSFSVLGFNVYLQGSIEFQAGLCLYVTGAV